MRSTRVHRINLVEGTASKRGLQVLCIPLSKLLYLLVPFWTAYVSKKERFL